MVYSLLQSYDKYRFTSRYIANSSRPYALYFRSVEELFSEKTQLFPIIGNPLLGNFSSREVRCLPEYGQRFAELFKREPFPVRLYIYIWLVFTPIGIARRRQPWLIARGYPK